MTSLPARLLALHARLDAKLGAGFIDDVTPDEMASLTEAAAALSGREAVACQFQDREGEWRNFANDKHRDDTIADGSWPIRWLYTTPQPGDGVVVPRWLLEQVYGMAREGCEVPNVGYRWCERIDSIMHGAEPESEYAAWARPLPAKFPAAPSAKGGANG